MTSEKEKIIQGLDKVREKLIAFKRFKGSPLVVSRDGKVVEVSPFDLNSTSDHSRH